MAQKIHVVLEDDIDGGDADETVSFGLDGTNYEIDLNDANATALRDALSSYVGHARRVAGGRGGARRKSAGGGAAASGGTSNGGPSAKEIREWARSNGHEVPERGRIPADVRDAFESAN